MQQLTTSFLPRTGLGLALLRAAGIIAMGPVLFGALLLAQDQVMRVSESDGKKAVINRQDPEYPAIARQLRVSGQVVIDAIVDPSGKVEEIKVLSGNPLLSASVIRTVKTWRFSPFTSNGAPSKAIVSFSFAFKI